MCSSSWCAAIASSAAIGLVRRKRLHECAGCRAKGGRNGVVICCSVVGDNNSGLASIGFAVQNPSYACVAVGNRPCRFLEEERHGASLGFNRGNQEIIF